MYHKQTALKWKFETKTKTKLFLKKEKKGQQQTKTNKQILCKYYYIQMQQLIMRNCCKLI